MIERGIQDYPGNFYLKIAVKFAFFIAIISISGCTQYWAKPGGTNLEFEATKSSCISRSYSQFPPLPEQVLIMAGYTTPLQTTCSGSGYAVHCFTTGGQYIPPSYVTIDRNENARNSASTSCLYESGWQKVKNKSEAEQVTNSYPASSGNSQALYSVNNSAMKKTVRFAFRNSGSLKIIEMYASGKTEVSWTKNLLASPLLPNEEQIINISQGSDCEYDVRVVTTDQRSATATLRDLCNYRVILFPF